MAHTRMKKTIKGAKRNQTGSRIRQARLRCSPPVSQDNLAGRVAKYGVTLDRSAISRIESQERYLMDYELIAIARALRVGVDWLCSQPAKTPPK
jgi:hypothetical protein